jgi:predicted enzyme related to lactoylglutathione lyase
VKVRSATDRDSKHISKESPMATRKRTTKKSATTKKTVRAKRPVRKKPQALRVRAVLPGLTVGNLDKSLAFYVGALGCVLQEEWKQDGVRTGAMLKTGRTGLGLGQDDWKKGKRRKKGQGIRLYLETAQDIDALAGRIRDAGFEILAGPQEESWGVYSLSVDDPDGFHLTIFKPTKPAPKAKPRKKAKPRSKKQAK